MLLTTEKNVAGKFAAPEGNRLLWREVDLNPDSYYFLVEGSGLVDGCFGAWARLMVSVDDVDRLCRGESGEVLSVSKVYLIAPPWMTGRPDSSMELLSELRVRAGTEASPVFEFVTDTGHIYLSRRR